MTTRRIVLIACLSTSLFGCTPFEPRQISRAEISSGMPPLTGVLPNGIMADNASK